MNEKKANQNKRNEQKYLRIFLFLDFIVLMMTHRVSVYVNVCACVCDTHYLILLDSLFNLKFE